MIFEEKRVSSFSELHEILSTYLSDQSWIYRGQSNSAWKLLPKAGREPYSRKNDRKMLEAWKLRALEYIDFRPQNDWEWLALAQHHGLATRLLDWTYNPLVAAFFAVNKFTESDSVIWCFKSTYNYSESTQNKSPFEVNTIAKYTSYNISRRISNQHSVFTVHPKPKISLNEFHYENEDIISAIIITKKYRKSLLVELSNYGFNNSTIFPDLDGLSMHFNWLVENNS